MGASLRKLRVALLVMTVVAGVTAFSYSSVSAGPLVSEGNYIVHLKDGDLASVIDSVKSVDSEDVSYVFDEVIDGFVAELTGTEVQQIQRHPDVAFVEPDLRISIARTDSADSWGLDRIDQRNGVRDGQYSYDTTGAGVVVYIFDTGVEASHSQFALSGGGTRVMPGFSAISGYAANEDCHGHGTHVAGTVGGATHGVAKDVIIVPIKVLDCDGGGGVSGIVAGVDWVLRQHIPGTKAIANLSLGAGGISTSLTRAINRLDLAGIVPVVAAGNSNKDACNFSPANVPAAVTVGAVDANTTSNGRNVQSNFSNFGTCLDLYAPGSAIRSSYPGNRTALMSGTSMATPHVAGAIALAWEAQPQLGAQQVSDLVIANASLGKISSSNVGSPNKLLFVPKVGSAPSAPLNPVVTYTESVTTVTWDAPLDDGDSAIDEYYVVSLADGQVCTTVPSDENGEVTAELSCVFNDASLHDGTFVVIASNQHGSSVQSELVSTVVTSTPAPVTVPGPVQTPVMETVTQPITPPVVAPVDPTVSETVMTRRTMRVRQLLRKMSVTINDSQQVKARIHRQSKNACSLRNGTLRIKENRKCVVTLRVIDSTTRMHSANVFVSVVRKSSNNR